MKIKLFLIGLLLMLAGLGLYPTNAHAQTDISADLRVSFFYDPLLTYGTWTWHGEYGWCWHPNVVAADWRPYMDGSWDYTQYGWTWVSDEPWGWACYHYGRWFFDSSLGWLWIPDTVWGPAWVVWRYSDDWVGWAPCPPQFVWRAGVGLNFGVRDIEDFVPQFSFCFVRERNFLEPHVRNFIELSARNVTIIGATRVVTGNFRLDHDDVINETPFREKLERDLGRPVRRYRITAAPSLAERKGVAGEEINMFMPREREMFSHRESSNRSPENRYIAVPGPNPAKNDLEQMRGDQRRILREQQMDRKRILNEQQSSERRLAPASADPGEIEKRHQRERRALDEQIKRENKTFLGWQDHEKKMKRGEQDQGENKGRRR